MRFWGGLGLVLLMANDLLDFGLELGIESEQEIMSTVAEFIPIAEHAIGTPSLLNSTARSVLMMGRFVESLRERKEFIDFAERFRRATGMVLADYQALCIGLISHYMKLDVQAFRSNPGCFLLSRDGWSRNTAVPESISDLFLSQISATPEEISKRLQQRDYGSSDFTWIRNAPIYATKDGYFPFDLAYLSEKLQSGPFWAVHDSMACQERPKLHAFWGLVFEGYVHWLLSSAVGPKNLFVASPKFQSTSTEACDAMLRCGSSIAVFEFKGSMLTAQAKYSGQPKLLASEIDKKLVGSASEKKGVAQLSHVIRRLFDPKSSLPLEGIDLSGIRTIYPVLVTRDDVGSAVGINLYLNKKFREIFNSRCVRPLRVTPLFCLSVEDLELISGYLSEAAFTEILEARYDNDRSLASTFAAVNNEVMRKIGRRRNKHLEQAFAAGMDVVCERLFPGRRLDHPYLHLQPGD